MAHISVGATIGISGVSAAHRSDPQDASTNAAADEAAVSADITAALANVTISGNPTATSLVTQIQTDFATLIAGLAAGGATPSQVLVSYDPAAVISKNQLVNCLNAVLQVVRGAADLM